MASSGNRTPAPSSSGRDRKPRSERWEEILGAAARCFYQKGYDATSLQDIADEVGILKGSIYYYIKTKDDLRGALLVDVHKTGLEMIRLLAETPGDSLEKLGAMIRGHIQYIKDNLDKTTVYLDELKKVSKGSGLIGKHDYRNVFREVIQRGQEEGTLLPDLDPDFAAQAMLGALNSMCHWYRPQRGKSVDTIVDHFVTVILRGHASEKGLKKLARR